MKNFISRNKPTATFDAENHRFIITPVDTDKAVSVGTVLRAIKETVPMSWRAIMAFTGHTKQSDIFKMAYASGHCSKKLRDELAKYITVSGTVAYLYDKDHKPAGATETIIHPTITNGDASGVSVVAKIASLVATRVVIHDRLDRTLQLSVTVPDGYLISTNKITLASPGGTITTKGNARKLNTFLKSLKYASANVGKHDVIITVNDLTGVPAGILTVSIPVTVTAGVTTIIPEITVPATVDLAEEGDTTIPAITVTGNSDEILSLKISTIGCELYNIKNYLSYLADGETYTTQGTATQLTANLAALKVRADDEAKVMLELTFGSGSHIRKTISIVHKEEETNEPPKVDDAVTDGSTLTE